MHFPKNTNGKNVERERAHASPVSPHGPGAKTRLGARATSPNPYEQKKSRCTKNTHIFQVYTYIYKFISHKDILYRCPRRLETRQRFCATCASCHFRSCNVDHILAPHTALASGMLCNIYQKMCKSVLMYVMLIICVYMYMCICVYVYIQYMCLCVYVQCQVYMYICICVYLVPV